MHCCPICFSSTWLKSYIEEHSAGVGDCYYCESKDVQTIEVRELAHLFHNLMTMYGEADSFESGTPLIELIQWNWGVFDEDTLDSDTQASLLQAIVNSDWDDLLPQMVFHDRPVYQEEHAAHSIKARRFVLQ
jgi:hypothetical protein